MEHLSLTAIKREKKTKGHLNSLRKSGQVPAVVYGLDTDSENISIEAGELRKILVNQNQNQIINLQIEGNKQQVLIKSICRHTIFQNEIVHLDFIRVDKSRPVTVNIPIKHVGVASGVKNEGGLFSVMKRFVKVKCHPQKIPAEFTQDVTDLAAGSIVYAGDLQFPQGTILTPPKTALYGVTSARAEVEETPEGEPDDKKETTEEDKEGATEEKSEKDEKTDASDKTKKEAKAKN
jgi:large subunit ribosomal protein L25